MPIIEVQGHRGLTAVSLVDHVGDMYRVLRYCDEIDAIVPGPDDDRYGYDPAIRAIRILVDFGRNDQRYRILVRNLFGTVEPRLRVLSPEILLGPSGFSQEIESGELDHILWQLGLEAPVGSR